MPYLRVCVLTKQKIFHGVLNTLLILLHYILDNQLQRFVLSKIEYQFTGKEHDFKILPHGNSKSKGSFARTKASTINKLRTELLTKASRIAISNVSENIGGILGANSSGCLPRNISQAYNLKKRPNKIEPTTDLYNALILACTKEDAKSQDTAFIREVYSAPDPIVVLATNE